MSPPLGNNPSIAVKAAVSFNRPAPESTVRLLFLAVTILLASCAAFQQGLKDARDGIKPKAEALPEGEGWHCYAANEKTWSGCSRTLQDCNATRTESFNQYRLDNVLAAEWGRCLPAVQVFCATYEASNISNGKMEDRFGCFPDSLGCTEWARNPPSGAFRMSSCDMFK